MSAIRGEDTAIEVLLRTQLHQLGYRYRKNVRKLPGRPDIVLSKYRAAIFVHGCFWHGHDCDLFRWPSTNAAFWREKIGANQARDDRSVEALRTLGWRVLTVWECALRHRSVEELENVLSTASRWITSADAKGEIRKK